MIKSSVTQKYVTVVINESKDEKKKKKTVKHPTTEKKTHPPLIDSSGIQAQIIRTSQSIGQDIYNSRSRNSNKNVG